MSFPVSRLVDPIFLLLVAIGAGLFVSGGAKATRTRWVRIGRGAAWAGWLTLWILATPWIANSLVRWASMQPHDLHPELDATSPEQRVLVVIATGMDPDEHRVPAMERLAPLALERCIAAARIYKEYGFGRVIVSGRDPDVPAMEMTGGMADLLVALGVPRGSILLESESLDTKENALFSTRMVQGLKAEKTVLVTSAIHMPRAMWLFERAGLKVIPAPVKFQAPARKTLARFIPESEALGRSQRLVHELLGLLEP
jgi:uncharacterized SAM-binding protein YcdF (DUF218 family)